MNKAAQQKLQQTTSPPNKSKRKKENMAQQEADTLFTPPNKTTANSNKRQREKRETGCGLAKGSGHFALHAAFSMLNCGLEGGRQKVSNVVGCDGQRKRSNSPSKIHLLNREYGHSVPFHSRVRGNSLPICPHLIGGLDCELDTFTLQAEP